jgi:hypothetical protein
MLVTIRQRRRRSIVVAALFGLGVGAAVLIGAHPVRTVPTASLAVTSEPRSQPVTSVELVDASTPTLSPSGSTGIQVGPTTTPTVPPPDSGGAVSGGSLPSPGLFDITGHIEAAIDGWFSDLVTSALNPVLSVLGQTLLATPDVTNQSRVAQLWGMTEGIADASLVLFVLAGAAIVMGHETVQTRTALKDIAPRVVVAAVAANASLSLAGLAISTADSLSQAVLGQGVDPAQATVVLRQLIFGAMTGGGIFVVLLGGVVAILAVVLLATFVIRTALVILLVVAAPLALICHALPQTEGLSKLWWRAFAGALLVQVGQSLVLVTALRVFLASGGPTTLGIASTGGMVDLLVAACLCWVLVKIPTWVGRMVFSNGGRRHSGGTTRILRDLIVYKGIKAVAAGVGL